MWSRDRVAVAAGSFVAGVTLSALFAVAADPAGGEVKESKEAKIARAMKAAPEAVSAEAKVVDVDGTVLREGSNGWVCQPGLVPGDDHPICNDDVWMKWMQAFGAKKPFETDRVGISYMLAGDLPTNNDDPFDTTRDEGEPWVEEGAHLMIVFPSKDAIAGLPDDPNAGGPYVMWKDTPYAHVMVPVGPRK